MHVCHIVPSLEERHGGPSKSVRRLADAQAALGPEVTLLSTIEPGQPAPDVSGEVARIRLFAREAPLRLCRSRGLRAAVLAGSADYIHHHSLWLLTLHYAQEAAHRSGRPLIISPRGMFSPWAYRHHRLRKALAALFVHPGAFAAATGWHATSAEEADDIRRLGFTQPICTAPNGVDLPDPVTLADSRARWLQAYPQLAGRRVALFYSRFHRKKRVRELIELWTSQPRGDWLLLVAGIPEEYSVAELQHLAGNSGVVIADSTGLPLPYAAAELFLLPSHSENFGLVVAEALASGVPALVTDSTPWSLLASEQAGACVSWESYHPELTRWLGQPAESLSAQGRNARALAARRYTWAGAAQSLLDFYRQLPHA